MAPCQQWRRACRACQLLLTLVAVASFPPAAALRKAPAQREDAIAVAIEPTESSAHAEPSALLVLPGGGGAPLRGGGGGGGGEGRNVSSRLSTALAQVDASTAIEPVTVGALLVSVIVGDLVSLAITYSRLGEAEKTEEALRQYTSSLLEEREDVCVAAQALSFSASLLMAQTQVLLEAAASALDTNRMEQGSGAGKLASPSKPLAAPLVDAHAALMRRQRIQQAQTVRSLCVQDLDSAPLNAQRRVASVAKEIAKLRDRVMDDWTNLMFDVFDYTLFDPTFNAALPSQGTKAVVSNIILGGGMEGTIAVFEDDTIKELNEMLGNKTAPLWIARVLNLVSHFCDSGIVPGVQTHAEVISYAVRGGSLRIAGLRGSLSSFVKEVGRNPKLATRLAFGVVDVSFWLTRDIFRIIHGAGQVVPWPIVAVWAIFKNIRVAFEITENLVGFSAQKKEHKRMIEMNEVELKQQWLNYRFSACTSFHRANVAATQQLDILDAFEEVLEATPEKRMQHAFGISSGRTAAILQESFENSPQFMYQVLVSPSRDNGAPSDQRQKALPTLFANLCRSSRLARIIGAATAGPITDLAVSEDTRNDETYAALGYFQPIPGWPLWACRGCSARRILHLRACYGLNVVDCLEQGGAEARLRFSGRGRGGGGAGITVEVLTLPSTNGSAAVLGDFAELYQVFGVRPRLLVVSAVSSEAARGRGVLYDLHWMRHVARVPMDNAVMPGPRAPVSVAMNNALQNKVKKQHRIKARAMQADIEGSAGILAAGGEDAQTRVEVLWKGHGVFDDDRYEEDTGLLRRHKFKLVSTVWTLDYISDVGSATFRPEAEADSEHSAERHSSASGRSFVRLLITEGHACHLSSALRLSPGVSRVGMPAEILDASTYYDVVKRKMIEGWLLDETAWFGNLTDEMQGDKNSGFTKLKKAIASENRLPFRGLDRTKLRTHWPEARFELPGMRCAPLMVVELKTGRRVDADPRPGDGEEAPSVPGVGREDVAICLGSACPPVATRIPTPGREWTLLSTYLVRSKRLEVWLRRSALAIGGGCRPAQAEKPNIYTREELHGLVARSKGQLAQMRSPLVGALCSSEQCHFRQSSDPLPRLLGLPDGPAKRPKYLVGRWSEAVFFGDDGTPEGAPEGMPQLAFYRRRRASCYHASSLVRKLAGRWSEELPRLSTLSEQDVIPTSWTLELLPPLGGPPGLSAGAAATSVAAVSGALFVQRDKATRGKKQEQILDAAAEVLQAGSLRRCSFPSETQSVNGSGGVSFARMLAAVERARSASCGFELVLPMVPEVSCKEEDGFGLAVDTAPDGTITERCAPLANTQAVESYLLWVSLRPLGRDTLGNLRWTGQSVESALTSQFGYTKHAPFSRQPAGCTVGELDEDSAKDGKTYVFRQEVWSRRDPRLSETALGTSRSSMCEESKRLMDLSSPSL